MKKLMSILALAALLLALTAPALASDQAMIDHLVQVVEAALVEGEYVYDYDAEYEAFELEFNLDSSLKSTEVTLFVYDDMVSVSAALPLAVAEEHRDRMAVFLTLINSQIYYAQLRMDYEDGEVTCRSAQLVETVIPGAEEIYVLLEMPVAYMGIYADGIARVALGGDPFEAFALFDQ